MATTKKTSTASRTRKAAPAPTPEPEADGKAERAAKNGELTAKVVEMREGGSKWGEIAEALDITPGKAMFLEMKAQVADNPKLAIKFSGDEDLTTKVIAARNDDMLSWGQISARTGVSEGKLKKLWEAGGLPQSELMDVLIGHAIARHERRNLLALVLSETTL